MAASFATTAATDDAVVVPKASLTVQASLALLLGVLVIGVAGFSQVDVIHNAAHDTRHANGFPCH